MREDKQILPGPDRGYHLRGFPGSGIVTLRNQLDRRANQVKRKELPAAILGERCSVRRSFYLIDKMLPIVGSDAL
jgi:hypothetical protein